MKIVYTDNRDMDEDPQFMKIVDVPGNGGFSGSMHRRAMEENEDGETVREVAIVHTDIAAPKATAFEKVKDAAGGFPQALNHDLDHNDDADNNDNATDDYTALKVVEEDFGQVKSDDFSASSAATLEFLPAAGEGDQPRDAAEVMGYYNGAPGTYTCTGNNGAACTVEIDGKGKVTGVSMGWIFTPDAGATSDVPDSRYLSYGFWLINTTKDGAVTYNEVETFATATGMGMMPTGGIESVTGSATYGGGAAGVYVKNVLDDQANIVSATSGHFSANVELNATFGGDTIANFNKFTIDGEITDFTLHPTGGGPTDNDWGVKLGLADFSSREGEPGKTIPGPTFVSEFSGTATGDSTAVAGSWNGIFYGATDGTAAGAFGANKK